MLKANSLDKGAKLIWWGKRSVFNEWRVNIRSPYKNEARLVPCTTGQR